MSTITSEPTGRTAKRTPADRVGVSTITFRFRPLEEALTLIEGLGATEVDMGAIPAVTDHVPVPFTGDTAASVRRHLRTGRRGDHRPVRLTDARLDASRRTTTEGAHHGLADRRRQ